MTNTVEGMIKYLKQWNEDTPVEFCIVNPADKVFYKIQWTKAIIDLNEPCFVIGIGDSTPFDEELRKLVEKRKTEVHA